MNWTDKESKEMIDSLQQPFTLKSKRSKASIGREKSCYDPNVLFKYLVPQIKETLQNKLGWETPEEWDKSFKILGGGQSRRTSSGILSIITWEQFLNKVNEIKEKEGIK